MQYIVLFSQRTCNGKVTVDIIISDAHNCQRKSHVLTVHDPSVSLFQKHELAVCNPAPFFCMIVLLTVGETNGKIENVLAHLPLGV